MENNDYKESVLQNDLSLDSEVVLENENIIEAEAVASKKEENLEKIVVADDDSDEPERRREEKELQSESNSSSSSCSSGGGSMAGIVGAAAAGATMIILIVSMIASISISLLQLNVFGTSMNYSFSVSMEIKLEKETVIDYDNFNTGLFLSVYNSKQNVLIALVSSDDSINCSYEIKSKTDDLIKIEYRFSGNVQGLKENTRYNLEVFGDNSGSKKSYFNQSFKTTEKTTQFNAVNAECRCQEDGNLYFQLDFLDENNYYSEFNYTLTKFGESLPTLSGKIEGMLTKPQAIEVASLLGKNYILEITFTSSAPADAENPLKKISINVEI